VGYVRVRAGVSPDESGCEPRGVGMRAHTRAGGIWYKGRKYGEKTLLFCAAAHHRGGK